MATREIKNAIQMKHLCNVQALVSGIKEGDTDVHVIAYVLGRANGVSFRSNPNGEEPAKALTGVFEATPVEEGRSIIDAPAIFLPKAFTEIVSKMLVGDQQTPARAPKKGAHVDVPGVTEIPLALQIGVRRVKGDKAVNYEWSVETLNSEDMRKTDALADLRKSLPAQLQTRTALPQLAAPAAEKPAPKRKRK